VDLSGEMLAQARRRAAQLGLCESGAGGGSASSRVRFVRGDATSLPFDAASFDTVLDTFSLCVLGDAAPRALAEMARLVRPGGRVLLLEHSRSSFEPLGAYQDATAEAVAASGKGCFWNQRVAEMLPAAGLRIVARRDALGGTLTVIEAQRVAGPDAAA
jgi:ubiquinone/menaquinone biosynthesis C-methylase UbiE